MTAITVIWHLLAVAFLSVSPHAGSNPGIVKISPDALLIIHKQDHAGVRGNAWGMLNGYLSLDTRANASTRPFSPGRSSSASKMRQTGTSSGGLWGFLAIVAFIWLQGRYRRQWRME